MLGAPATASRFRRCEGDALGVGDALADAAWALRIWVAATCDVCAELSRCLGIVEAAAADSNNGLLARPKETGHEAHSAPELRD